MHLSPEFRSFIQEHISDDTDRLLLVASRFPDIDMPFAVDQILARRQIKDKLPSWYANENLIFPSRLSAEQCSSEITACYKQGLLAGKTFCDLTGGLGIDTYYFAQSAEEVHYIERFPEYCKAAKHNFQELKAENIQVHEADSRDIISSLKADTFYIDPARRAGCNQRVFALADCEPDVLQLKPILLDHARRLIVKISPMADLEETLRLLPETREIHILSIKNECKELLFILESGELQPFTKQVCIHAINFTTQGEKQIFSFYPEEEKIAELHTGEPGKYLYEPHAALLKSGAFKLIAQRFNLSKLHKHSHLYSSDTCCEDFPGRIFKIDNTYEFSGKLLKQLRKEIPQANITIRNFQLSVAELRKRTHIKEGGEHYLFATTLASERKVIFLTHKV